MKTIKMEEMNWPDIKSALKKGYNKVIVGVGSMEQHGPHLPTITDTLIGDALANRVALKLGGDSPGKDHRCWLFNAPPGFSRNDFNKGRYSKKNNARLHR